MSEDKDLLGDAPKKRSTVSKPNYTADFEKFWAAYPRKTAKFKAFESWQRHVDDETAPMVIADVEKRGRMNFWAADKSKIPMPTTFLNQHRWEDEWVDEVTTRGKENKHVYVPRSEIPKPKEEPEGPLLSGWTMMCNRLMRSYLMACGGVSDVMLQGLVREKKATLDELEPVIAEELEMVDGEERKAKRVEMAYLLAKTMLTRFDQLTGKILCSRMIDKKRSYG